MTRVCPYLVIVLLGIEKHVVLLHARAKVFSFFNRFKQRKKLLKSERNTHLDVCGVRTLRFDI